MNTKKTSLILVMGLVSVFHATTRAAELTSQQRQIADAVVSDRVREVQVKRLSAAVMADLVENVRKLSERKKEWHASQPAMRIGFSVKELRGAGVPIPDEIDAKVVADIIWQYENAYGEGNKRKYHREECALALGLIGHPDGIPTLLVSLQEESGHYSWKALEGVSDTRFIPAIEKHLDFTSQQDAFPAIRCLGNMGTNGIQTLERFLSGNDLALKRGAVKALIRIQSAACIPILETLRDDSDKIIARKAQSGVMLIRSRIVDRIYTPPQWSSQDDVRLSHLTSVALVEDEPIRSKAAAALLRIGEPTIWHLRCQLPNYSHGDAFNGPHFYVSERAASLLLRIGRPAIPALIDALCDEHEHGRQFAVNTLQKLTGLKMSADYGLWSAWYLGITKTDT
jgi:HEAT repeat protein